MVDFESPRLIGVQDLPELGNENRGGPEGQADDARDPRGDFQKREPIRQIDHEGGRREYGDNPDEVRKAIEAGGGPDETEDGEASFKDKREDRLENEVEGCEGPTHEEDDLFVDDDKLPLDFRGRGREVDRYGDPQAEEWIEERDDESRDREDHHELGYGIEPVEETVPFRILERPDRLRDRDFLHRGGVARLSQEDSPFPR